MIYMLDTDIASYIVKERRPSLRPKFVEYSPEQLCVSAETKSELLFGLKQLDMAHHLHLKVRRFLQDVNIVSWGYEAAEVHADIRHRMLSVGRTFGEMDMMIAAHAISLGAVLVTNNTRHFERLAPALTIENWAVVDG